MRIRTHTNCKLWYLAVLPIQTCQIRGHGSGIFVFDPPIRNYLYLTSQSISSHSLAKQFIFVLPKIIDWQYLNGFIDLEVEKDMRHHKFNEDEIGWCILLSRIWILIQSGLCWEFRPRSSQKPDQIRNTGYQSRKKLHENWWNSAPIL
jgi:hypothetical protein